jgi:diaminohydroxyphosphoribosylaminopyrimidine deaminase / 5-amino-6-(5-phosphoribosylamino)uracil reductase
MQHGVTLPGRAPDGDRLEPQVWRRLLRRRSEDAGLSALYGPLLARPTAPDGCFVYGRLAQSLDGRIATACGASRWISGEADIRHMHRLRALADALVIGAGTVRADDPQLTTREVPGLSPVRVVCDTDRRLDGTQRLFHGGPPTLLLCADDVAACPLPAGVEVLRLPRAGVGLSIPAILACLAERGLRRLYVEGGGITVSRFLAAGALDRLHVTVAPLLLGSGIPAFTLPEAIAPTDGLRLNWSMHRLGEDLLLDIPLGRARPPVCS